MTAHINRRGFLKTSACAAGALATGFTSAPAIARVQNANELVTLGFIGTGRMGLANIGYQLKTGKTRIAAVCDVYKPNLQKAVEKTNGEAEAYRDFRKILDRKDIDAVIISTPDHWHALQTTLACEAGKDVFVEKPMSTSIAESRRMIEVAQRTGKVIQVGTMQRSAKHFQRAVEIVKSGVLGKISFVRCWNMGNAFPVGIGNPPDSDPPADLDWDLWLGPAPERRFNWNRFGVGDRWSTFRYFWDYAGGMLTDWGIHLMDIVLWAMNTYAPKYISSAGGKYFVQDNRDTPDTLQVTYEFEDWTMTYTNQACNAHGIDNRGYGIQFYGTDATFFVDRQGYELIPEYSKDGIESLPKTSPLSGSAATQGNLEHAENFLKCIKTRQKPICHVEEGHASGIVPHLGNIALRSNSRLKWDAQKEQCIDNPVANKLLTRDYRSPWKLPKA